MHNIMTSTVSDSNLLFSQNVENEGIWTTAIFKESAYHHDELTVKHIVFSSLFTVYDIFTLDWDYYYIWFQRGKTETEKLFPQSKIKTQIRMQH